MMSILFPFNGNLDILLHIHYFGHLDIIININLVTLVTFGHHINYPFDYLGI